MNTNYFTDVLNNGKCAENFQGIRKIGEGSFGQVFGVKDELTSEMYALKKIGIRNLGGKGIFFENFRSFSEAT